MSYYLSLLVKGAVSGDVIEALGSDANPVLDGRLSISNAILYSHRILETEQNFKGSYIGFILRKGDSLRNSVVIFKTVL